MNVLKFRIEGSETPLVCHNRRLANPLDPIVKEMKAITSKRKKTDEDYLSLFWLEFQGGLYYDDNLGPYVPGENVFAAIQEAARLSRKGAQVERGVQVAEQKCRLDYEGPRTVRAMYDDNSFVDVRGVVVNGNRTMRCRPIFQPPWSLAFTVTYNPEQFNEAEIRGFVNTAGSLTGLCEMRPRYGKFTAKLAG